MAQNTMLSDADIEERILNFKNIKMKIKQEVFYTDKNGEEQCLNVEFEAFPRVENDGIGSYEYGGSKGFDVGHNYVSLEENGDPTWDKSKYTDEQNNAIENMDKKELCERFCNKQRIVVKPPHSKDWVRPVA